MKRRVWITTGDDFTKHKQRIAVEVIIDPPFTETEDIVLAALKAVDELGMYVRDVTFVGPIESVEQT